MHSITRTGTAAIYSTFIGGSGNERSYRGLGLDSDGNAYITGLTFSPDFPVTAGAYQTILASTETEDAFVTKINANGNGLVYSTYIGGNSIDVGTHQLFMARKRQRNSVNIP